jgi:hypothetical protein
MKMNKAYFYIILFVGFVGNLLYSQELPSASFNGKDWNEFSEVVKCTYLNGIDDGLSWALTLITQKSSKQKCFNEIETIILNSILDKTSYIELTKEIDYFYKSGPNLNIPILFAYDYIKRKYLGENISELEKSLNIYRATFNK